MRFTDIFIKSDLYQQLIFVVEIFAAISLIFLIFGYVLEIKTDKKRRYLILFSVFEIILLLVNSFSLLFMKNPETLNLFKTFLTLTYIFAAIELIFYHIYFVESTKDKLKISSITIFILIGIETVCIILWIISIFSGLLLQITPEGKVIYSKNFLYTQISAPFIILYELVILLINVKKFKKREFFAWLLYCILPLASITLHNKTTTNIFFISIYFSIIIVFTLINVNEEKVLLNKEKELSLLKLSNAISQRNIFFSQIQPHFIYNSLANINAIIEDDPQKAEEAINKFSTYLRTKFKSTEKTQFISFSEEIKHIENYIWLEKLRFNDRLKIKYELETEDFIIPMCTIQPIVENSVKHGICKKKEGGIITIKTTENDDNIIIQVIDDGIGFDKDNIIKEHGLWNLQNVFEQKCNARFEINSIIGIGSTITIILPKKA